MGEFVQLSSIVLMFTLSYLGLRAFGPPKQSLSYSRQERADWESLVSESKLGALLTRTNIIGTLTSFATVLIFFLGSSRLFGIAILSCVLALWLGGPVTNWFTERIKTIPTVAVHFRERSQTGAVIAALSRPSWKGGVQSAFILKWISLLNIAGVIWLEFAIFTDFAIHSAGFSSSLLGRTIALCVISFVVFISSSVMASEE